MVEAGGREEVGVAVGAFFFIVGGLGRDLCGPSFGGLDLSF